MVGNHIGARLLPFVVNRKGNIRRTLNGMPLGLGCQTIRLHYVNVPKEKVQLH